MVTSTAIESSIFLNTTEKSSSTSSANKSSGFDDVFSNVNKSYDTKQDSKNNVADTTTNKTEQKTKTDSNDKIKDKTTNEKEKTEDVTNKEETSAENKTNDTVQAEKTEETDQTKKVANETDSDKKTTEADVLAYQSTEITSKIIESLEAAATAAVNSTTVTPQTQQATTPAVVENVIASTQQMPEVVISVNTDLPKTTQNLASNITNQPIDKNAKLELQQVATPAVEQKAQDSQEVQQTPQKAETETIQVSANLEVINKAVAADVNVNTEINTNTKDSMSKTVLTQDMIDQTNAKITNVEGNSKSSSNSNNNLMNKQNAQEQAIKLSLESKSSKTTEINPGITGATDATSQLNFSKTIDNIQAQPPKEISGKDILAQINKQLDGLKNQDQGTTKVTIVLRPENLGKINLELVNSKDGLTAKMTTDNAQVKELLDKSLNSLKDTLGSQGVSVNNVSVKLNETQKQDGSFNFNDQMGQGQQQSPNNSNQANDKEFSFSNEINKASGLEKETVETTETTGATESTVSVGSNLGQVDYKV